MEKKQLDFGVELKQYRKDNNLTQKQLGEKIAISIHKISKYENGITPTEADYEILNKLLQSGDYLQKDKITLDYIENLDNSRKLNYPGGNKDIEFKQILGIYIKNFRTFENKYIDLGSNLTIISGKNGTMKSTLLGLIAHPFTPNNSKCKDFFDIPLKTDMKDVFRLSKEKENTKDYYYYLHALTSKDKEFAELVKVYYSTSDNRHRVTVGGNKKGQGNFILNTSYLNLKRLYPIIDTKSQPVEKDIDKEYLRFIAKVYSVVFTKNTFNNVEAIRDQNLKTTFGPKDSYYDYNSISSGEDNLGLIINKLYAFQSNKSKHGNLQGILCIDEIDAGLHPVAQENLIKYILKWSKKNKVQVICTTHSLYLIQTIIKLQESEQKKSINLIMLSTQYIDKNNYNMILNPNYNNAYKELTFKDFDDNKKVFKPTIILEDQVAINTLKKIIGRKLANSLDYMCDITIDDKNPGISYNAIISLVKNGKKLFRDVIFILDGDMDENTSKNIEKLREEGANILKLPSFYNLPVEKEVVKYIYDLCGSNEFFIKNSKEKDAFINDFNSAEILNLESLKEIKETSTKKFKDWKDSVGNNEFSKCLTCYTNALKEEDTFKEFNELFVNLLNGIYRSKALPVIE